MGLFSRKKTISVSSVSYNLAGDAKDRIQYLPTAVVGGVLSGSSASLGETIISSLLGGPGIKMRSFARWSEYHGYSDAVGLRQGQLIVGNNVDTAVLASQIPHAAEQTVNLQTADLGAAEYSFWADQWLLENYPEDLYEDFVVDFNEVSNTIFITFPDTSFYSFNPVGFDPAGRYLYASYNLLEPVSKGAIVPGTVVAVASPAEYPSTTGWELLDSVTTPGSMPLVETVDTVITYSDGRPDEGGVVNTPTTGLFDSTEVVYQENTYLGSLLGLFDQIFSRNDIQHNMSTGVLVSDAVVDVVVEDIGGGVSKTTTTTTTTESVGTAYSYRLDTQEVIEKEWSPTEVFIYQYGSGNAVLDGLFLPDTSSGTFFPFIPIRLWNTFLSESYLPDLYAQNKKAYKKAIDSRSNKKYDELVETIKDNGSIGDVDFAHIVYGVSLNTEEKASKKYVYKFFQNLIQQGGGGVEDYLAWQSEWAVAHSSVVTWNGWQAAQIDPGNPIFGTAEPIKLPYPTVPNKSIQLASNLNFDMTISWAGMEETTGVGLGKPDAKVGDLWWTQEVTYEVSEQLYRVGQQLEYRIIQIDHASLHWQDGHNSYRTVSIQNLKHSNMVYRGKAVTISAKSALADTEESGFLVPLHDGILRSMSLKDSTQMATACTYVVFNSYEVVKQKWYQTSLFKILVIVAVVVVSIFYPPFTATSPGLLGTAASVGAALGFTGTVAIIVGAVANAIAAILLTKIITAGAKALFGDKVGEIVGAIASVIAVAYGSGYMSGAPIQSFSTLGTAKNLMALSLSVGNGYAGYMQASAQDMLGQTEYLLNNYERESREIAQAYSDNLGMGAVLINPISLTDAVGSFMPESPSSFLSRTLLVGGDIADLTNTMITDFTTMTLTTVLPA